MDNLDVRLLSVEDEALFDMQFHLIVVSVFLKNVCVKDRGDSSSRLLERRNLISMYRGAFVNAVFEHFGLL